MIVLGAVAVLLECARYQGGKVFVKNLVDVSANSIVTEYYRPLYKDYHVFFLAFQDGENQETYLKKRAAEYAKYSVNPTQDLLDGKVVGKRKSFLAPDTCSFEAKDLVAATDEGGKFFEKEAVAYMKYKSVEKLMEKLKGSLETVQSLKASTEAVEAKLKCEEELSKYSEEILELMKLIDGVTINAHGNVRIQNVFAKKLVAGEPTMNKLGMCNQKMWIKVKNRCVNVNELLQSISKKIGNINGMLEQQELLRNEKNSLSKKQVKEKRKLDQKVKELSDEIQELSEDIRKECAVFNNTLDEVKNKTDEVLKAVQKLKAREKGLSKTVEQYKRELNSKKGDMSEELRSSLKKDIDDISAVTKGGLSANQVELVIQKNAKILAKLNSLDDREIDDSKGSIEGLVSSVSSNLSWLQQYDTSSISFDYGDGGKESVENPVSRMKELLNTKLADLVLQEREEISNKKLTNLTLSQYSEKEENSVNLISIMKNLGKTEGTSNLFHLFGDSTISDVPANVLMLLYEEEHFGHFLHNNLSEKDKSLLYELEYILMGKNRDKENLYGVIEKAVMWRTVFNFISIMADSKKKGLARETAIALAGITGIEPLIHVTQTLILLTWSFEEALVDVAALLNEKAVPVLKKATSFLISYEDLLIIDRTRIQEKAKLCKNETGGLTYQSFLEILIFLHYGKQNRYRCMELINQNMRLRNQDNFNLSNCIYSFTLSTSAKMNSRFLFLQLGKKIVSNKDCLWTYEQRREISY